MTRRLVAACLFAAAAFATAPSAFAQSDCPPGGDTCIMIFGDEVIDGETRRPDGDVHTARGAAEFGSLIDIRTSFVDEAVEDAAQVL